MCDKCRDTGLLPFVKNGKVIPSAFLHCSCHPVYGDNPEPERYHQVEPGDYDFAMSSSFRAWTYQYCNRLDPGYVPPEPEPVEPKPQEIIHRHSDMSKKDYDLLQQTTRRVKYLENKLAEKTKPKRDTGYKGIK